MDHSETKGAPVIMENNPTYPNLFGAVERRAQFGALVTDFSLIRAGALQRANGGYLVLEAMDLLRWFFSYEALKRCLKNGEVKIEDPMEMFGMITTRSLQPQPIALNIKIILVGDPYIYQILYSYDEDFHKFFKIKAQFDSRMQQDRRPPPAVLRAVGGLLSGPNNLMPLHKTGMARLVEYAQELAGHQQKLTLQLKEVQDVVKGGQLLGPEQHPRGDLRTPTWTRLSPRRPIGPTCRKKSCRSSSTKGMLFIETEGQVVGQMNGLSVYALGDHAFGRPSRITASVGLGKEGVMTIDRESQLSGNIHNKGVLILAGYLKKPLCPEQAPDACRPVSASSRAMGWWKATAPPWRNFAPCCPPWPSCPWPKTSP